MEGKDAEARLNALAKLQEWILPEDSISLRREVVDALRADSAATKGSRSAAAKYGSGGLVEAMVLVGLLEKEGERVYERGELSPSGESLVAWRLMLSGEGLRDATGMSETEERAACRVLGSAGVLEIRTADDYRLLPSREDAPDGEQVFYVLRLEPLAAMVERVRREDRG